MTDTNANLIISIDSRQATNASADLDGLTAAGARAEKATAALAGEARAAMAGLTGISGAVEDFSRRAAALKASVDPLGSSMDRINAEMREADALYRVGALGAEQYAQGMRVLESRLESAVTTQNALTLAQARGGRAAGFTTAETLNLSRQFADLGVTAAMGMNPLMILIQQGPQIADIFGTAAARGVSFNAAMAQVGRQLGLVTIKTTESAAAKLAQATTANAAAQAELRLAQANIAAAGGAERAAAAATQAAGANARMGEAAAAAAAAQTAALAPLAIVLGAVAGIAAVAGIGLAVFTADLNKSGDSAKEVQARLGLTADQMERLKDKGTELGVTMGDSLKGIAIVAGAELGKLGALIWKQVGEPVQAVGKFIGGIWDWVVEKTVWLARTEIGLIGAAVGGIKAVWSSLGPALGDVMVTAANATIAAVEGMLNKVIGGINDMISFANGAAKLVGLDLQIPTLDLAKLGRIENSYAGAGEAMMKAFSKGAAEGEKQAIALAKGGLKYLGDLYDQAGAEAEKVADARIKKAAGKAPKGAAGAATPETDYDRMLENSTKAAIALEAEAKARGELNDKVAAGTITFAEANRQMELEKTLQPILAEADKAKGKEKQALLDVVERLTIAYRANTGEALRGEMLKAAEDRQPALDMLQAEIALIGESARVRAIALAGLKEEQTQKLKGFNPDTATDKEREAYTAAVASAQALVAKQFDLKDAQVAYNESLTATLSLLTEIDDQAKNAAAGMEKAFGNVGKALGGVLTLMTSYAAKQEDLNVRRKAEGVTVQQVAKIDREAAQARIAHYGDMIGAAQGFFKEGSDGYKALQIAEQAYRAWEFAASVQAMIQKTAETGVKVAADATGAASHAAAGAAVVATDAATTTSGIAAGAARIFAALGPYGFPVVAAMVAVMAGLGASAGGGGVAGVPISERRQREQGTGSVLGDATAKSDSIAKALDIVAANTNRDLEYSNSMLRALRSIDDSIGSLAAALARSLGASGLLGTNDLKLGSTTSGASLFGLAFGSTTTRTLKDQGLSFDSQTLGDILSGGLEAAVYQVIQTTKKSSFFGISTGSSTSTRTTETALDSAVTAEITRVIASLKDGVLAAASILGVEGADATLAAFQVSIGKISLKDMTGAEIEEALSAVFSKVGDDLAGAVVPGLTALQKVGEGLFETLVRVARQYQVVDVTLSSIGKTFGAVGLSSLEARERLVDLFGSLDDFTEQVSFYSENFLTEAERLAPIQSALTKELARLGLTGLDTRDEFKALVQSLDVSTAAGAELFAALMSIAPAFAAVTEETKAVTDARDALSSAYDREKSAIEGTRDSFRDLARSLGDYRASLYSGPTAALSPEAQYNAAKAEFQRIQALAATGNEDALGQLQGVSQEYLDASKAYFASSAGYFQDLEAVRAAVTAAEATATAQVDVAQAQLDALEASVAGLIDLNQSVLTVAQAIDALTVALGGQGLPGLASPTTAPSAPQSPPLPPQGQTTPAAANDNAGVVAELQNTNAQLQALVATQRASLEQQAAISAAQQARLEAIEAELNRQSRAALA